MAKRTKKEIDPDKEKLASIFDYISWLTNEKKTWEQLSYEDKKNFNVFIVNRFLSMDLYLCEAINDMQEYTLSMDKAIVWKIYSSILPKQKLYLKYIKSELIEGINEKDIFYFVKHFNCTEKQAVEYLQLLKKKNLEESIEEIKTNYKYEKI